MICNSYIHLPGRQGHHLAEPWGDVILPSSYTLVSPCFPVLLLIYINLDASYVQFISFPFSSVINILAVTSHQPLWKTFLHTHSLLTIPWYALAYIGLDVPLIQFIYLCHHAL